MNDLAKKWVAALRSGEYKQTHGTLHNDGGFCCLGVLCDIQGRRWFKAEHGTSLFVKEDSILYESMPSNSALDLVGMTESEANTLASANDSGKDFEQIANLIEKILG